MAVVPASSRTAAASGGVTVDSYVEFTSPVALAGANDAGATTIVTAASVTADGTSVYKIEFYCPTITTGATAAGGCIIDLYGDAAQIGRLCAVVTPANVAMNVPCYEVRYYTPAAAAIVFSVRGWSFSGTASATAGAGGNAAYLPGFIRVSHGG